jgi:hypothetical protein
LNESSSSSTAPVGNVLKALAAVQSEIEKVVKVKRQGMNYMVVMYDDLLDLIRDEVLKNDLTLVPHDCLHVASAPYQTGGGKHMNRDVYVFTFRLYHSSGEYLQISTPADAVDEMDKGPGKALTYATKTAWEKVLMLARGDKADPDSRPSASGGRTQQAASHPPSRVDQINEAAKNGPPPLKVTWDPATWPVQYQEMYKRDSEAYVDASGIEKYADWSWQDAVDHVEKYTKERNFPDDVRRQYVRGLTIKMLATGLNSRHAVKISTSLRETRNQDILRRAAGEDVLARIMEKIKAEEQKANVL